MTRLKGAYTLPLFPREDNQLLTPGLYTLGELTPIVPHYLRVCVCVRVCLQPPRLYRVVTLLPPVSPSAR